MSGFRTLDASVLVRGFHEIRLSFFLSILISFPSLDLYNLPISVLSRSDTGGNLSDICSYIYSYCRFFWIFKVLLDFQSVFELLPWYLC